ncbi:MAG TPA: c-type cytochrome [Terriglobales bacterium]|nr:c-type cytochrome [Terriglobales bacterium]
MKRMKAVRMRILLSVASGLLLTVPGFAAEKAKASPGEAIFKAKCVLCHGTDGQGKTTLGLQLKARDLNSSDVQSQKDAELKQVILHGQGNMPPFEEQLSAAQVDQVLAYVRSAFGKKKK